MRLLAQLSVGQTQREVVQYDTESTMSMRIPVVWMMSRRDKYDVDEDGGEDAGGSDYLQKDAPRRSSSFVRLCAALRGTDTAGSSTIRHSEYDVD